MENWEGGGIDLLQAHARMSEWRRIAAEERRARQTRARRREQKHRPWRLRRRIGLVLIAWGVALIEPSAAPSYNGKGTYGT